MASTPKPTSLRLGKLVVVCGYVVWFVAVIWFVVGSGAGLRWNAVGGSDRSNTVVKAAIDANP